MTSAMTRVFAVLRTAVRDLAAAPPGNVPGLDVLRTLAIVLVVSGHYYGGFVDARHQPLAIGKLPFFYFAWTGVDLFFVLSGYLIGRQLWRELSRRNTIDVGRFLLRRGLRIWPFYFAFLAWSVFWSPRGSAAFLPDLTFLSNYMPNAIAGGWSLSTEEQFYIFLPLLLLLLSTLLPARRQVLVVIGLLLVMPLIRVLTLHAHPGVSLDETRRLILFPFHTHADGLLAGVLIAWVSVMRSRTVAPLPLLRNLLVPAVLVVVGLALHSLNPRVFAFSGLALVFGAMTLFVLRDKSPFTRFAGAWGFYLISRLSYGMYLNHFRVLPYVIPLAAKPALPAYLGFLLGYPLAIAASMLVAAITFVTIESPFLQLRDRWLARRQARVATVRSDPSVAG